MFTFSVTASGEGGVSPWWSRDGRAAGAGLLERAGEEEVVVSLTDPQVVVEHDGMQKSKLLVVTR